MSKQINILILGRPNVGKSTVINRLLQQNDAITLDVSGVTRDLIEHRLVWKGRSLHIWDSGGMALEKKSKEDLIQSEINSRVKKAIAKATKIIFITDNKFGVHSLDEAIAKELRPLKEKVVLAVNKVDSIEELTSVSDFFRLGFGDPLPISAIHGTGFKELLNSFIAGVKRTKVDDVSQTPMYNIAIIGRPNVGKSSLLNSLANEDRVIVSDKAGTTRDAVDVLIENKGVCFKFIDTAGLRRKSKVTESVEFFSMVRTNRSIKNADCIVIVLEANNGIVKQDKLIIQAALDANKPFLIFINKWDLLERTDEQRKEIYNLFTSDMPPLVNYPFIFGSAKEKLKVSQLYQIIPKVIETNETRISTSELNQFIKYVIKQNPPPAKYGKRVVIYYATQAEISPPTFVCFVNNGSFVNEGYQRYLEKRIRQYFGGFIGCCVNIEFRSDQKADDKANNRLKSKVKNK
ncbi:ribosome biogenesis GTPase Der [Candidatus Marinamargulisbacteria bacterium SCGC AG-410-N11]|nr:ribosome biogenesis GTPase Der [Candidatus Marinamargulisbacteria bacterium SCGC AG-410-N11]